VFIIVPILYIANLLFFSFNGALIEGFISSSLSIFMQESKEAFGTHKVG